MTQEAETAPVELLIVSCSGCDIVFVASERRSTCPACGGEAVGPYLEYVMDAFGLHLKDGSLPAGREAPTAEEPAPVPEAAAAEAPAAEEAAEEEGETDWLEVLTAGVDSYLRDGGTHEDDLRIVLENRLGAEPEAAATAVGRLAAVRDLLRELAAAGVEAQEEVAAEETPAEPPPPAVVEGEGELPDAPETDQVEGD